MKTSIVEQISKLITDESSNILFLCGAGISQDSPTNLPTVNSFITDVLQLCNIDEETINNVYERYNQTNYRFESLVDQIRKNCDNQLLLTRLFDSTSFNKIHNFLSIMLQNGASVVTTNFDNCIENACVEDAFTPNRIVYGGKDLIEVPKKTNNTLIKIHGSHMMDKDENSELVITIRALAKTAQAFSMLPNWQKYVLELIQNKTIIVMGYSCSDDFDVVPLLLQSKPKKIIWLNYDPQNNIPVYSTEIKNLKIKKLSKCLPVEYYDGCIIPLLSVIASNQGYVLCSGINTSYYSVGDYIAEQYTSIEKRLILCNEIFLSYGMYSDIVIHNENPILELQHTKALFRLGEYDQVIFTCNQIKTQNPETAILMETLYFLSSALYHKADYIGALETIKKAAVLSRSANDVFFYLNALINYASILYTYASTLPKEKQNVLLRNAARKYRTVLRRAKGINIEAQATALWGLGDMERYLGNSIKAKELLQQSLEIHESIGNEYSINKLNDLIKTLQ